MLVPCCHCHEETNQVLIQVNSSKSTYDILLTTHRCHQCWQYNYGMCDRAKWDTEIYPHLNETEPRDNRRILVVTEPFNENEKMKIEFPTLGEILKTEDGDLIKDVVNYYKIEAERESIKGELDDC